MAHEHAYLVCEDMCMVEGVPKNTYDAKVAEIESDIGTLQESNPKCVDRYGIPTISILPITTHNWVTGQLIPTTGWVSAGSNKYTSGEYEIASNRSNVNNAFDNNLSSYWGGGQFTTDEKYFCIKFPNQIKIAKFKYYNLYNSMGMDPTGFIEGSNDGQNWNQLKTINISGSATNTWTTITLTDTGDYQYYRLHIPETGSGNLVLCHEFNTEEYLNTIVTNYNLLSFDYECTEYFTNMRILIDIPSSGTSFDDTLGSYININNLGRKLINQTITKGKKYELVYDGTAFDATEVV